MSNDEKEGQGGVPYTPSARKSIHSHNRCIFADCNHSMGRYGLLQSDKIRKAPTSIHEQGVDEIDNVLSKFKQPSSPLQVRQNGNKINERRNSLNTSSNSYSDDSSSNYLSKSLPANLPSNYYSDEIVHQFLPNDFYNIHLSTNENNETANRSNEYFSHGSFGSSSSEHKQTYEQKEHNTRQNKKSSPFLVLMIGVIVLFVAIYLNNFLELVKGIDSKHKSSYDESNYNKDMMELGERYKIDDHSMLEVQTGVSTIHEKNDTGSFIFLYNSNSPTFNYEKFSNFMRDIATTSARYLRNHSKTVEPTVVHSSQLDMQTHSELMSRYRGEVAKTGVMLLKDLDSLPPRLAMAFHYFCDEYNPLEAKTAIFFTLNLAKCFNTSDQKSNYVDIEKCLTRKWSAVPKDNIKPLLARVVNVVVDVREIS